MPPHPFSFPFDPHPVGHEDGQAEPHQGDHEPRSHVASFFVVHRVQTSALHRGKAVRGFFCPHVAHFFIALARPA
jgi:hypothetical protein